MKSDVNAYYSKYCHVVESYYLTGSESSLFQASELGAEILEAGFGPEDIAEIHQKSLKNLLENHQVEDFVQFSLRTGIPLIEVFIRYGIAFSELQEAKIKRQKADFYAVIDQTTDLVIFSDDEGVVEYANPAFLKLTIPKLTENSNVFKVFKKGQEYHIKKIQRALAQLERWNGCVDCLVSETKVSRFDLSLFPIVEHTGRNQFVWLLRDRQGREAVEKHIQHASKMESIGTLAAGVAHDFNNILMIIQGCTDLISDNITNKVDLENLNKITRASERGRDLINQILTFGKGDQEKPRELDPKTCIDEAIALLDKIKPDNIKIVSSINIKPTQSIYIDQAELHQILVNLSVNALHAIAQTEGTVEISLSLPLRKLPAVLHGKSPGKWVVLSVSDTGIGIPEDIIDRIFDPFFTTKDVGEGSGMGLSVVHGIVERLHGYIHAESEEGLGTTFHIYLPILLKKSRA